MTLQADHTHGPQFTQAQVRAALAESAEDQRKSKERYEGWLLMAADAGLTTRTIGRIVGLDSTTVSERIRRIRKASMSCQPEPNPDPIN